MAFDMNGWSALASRVNRWALANFGDQKGLGCLAPLLGMSEEVGELREADHGSLDYWDALGDILIFLCDYAERAGVSWNLIGNLHDESLDTCLDLSVLVGWVSHVQLKRLQGIRGFSEWEYYREQQALALAEVIKAIDTLSGGKALAVASKVFDSVVAKRKWHTDPEEPLTFEHAVNGYRSIAAELNYGVA